MGSGLSFVLLLGAAPPLRAERAVGLEAQGVDPLVALKLAASLDVRDELGRPVSARLIEAQLKQAQARAASRAAFASGLPQASAIAAVLEMLEALRLALRAGGAGRRPQPLFALPPTGRSTQRQTGLGLFPLALMIIAASRCPRLFRASFTVPSLSPVVLRC